MVFLKENERRLVSVRLDSYKPLREVVFEALREAIIKGVLKPGERLMEIQLAEELGVSRTPIREAFRKLELEGFVVMVPRKGAYVSGISIKDIVAVFEVRAALEGLAAELATERINDEELEELERILVQMVKIIERGDPSTFVKLDTNFHDVFYKSSRNSRLEQILSSLQDEIQRFRSVSLTSPGRMKEALEEHRAIVEAVAGRNEELARKLAVEHIECAEASLLNTVRCTTKEDENFLGEDSDD